MALPVLRQSAAVSTRTFGRDSNTTATTPNGSRRFSMEMPLGILRVQIFSPTGSGSPATWRTPSTIDLNLGGVSASLSTIAGEMPFFFAASTSLALSRIESAISGSALSST